MTQIVRDIPFYHHDTGDFVSLLKVIQSDEDGKASWSSMTITYLYDCCSEVSPWQRRPWRTIWSMDKLVSGRHDTLGSKVKCARSKVTVTTETWRRCTITLCHLRCHDDDMMSNRSRGVSLNSTMPSANGSECRLFSPTTTLAMTWVKWPVLVVSFQHVFYFYHVTHHLHK